MSTTVLESPRTLDAPPPPRRNDRPSDPPEPIPDPAALRYAARAYAYETHSERDADGWERIFATEGHEIRAAAEIMASFRRNPGVPSLAWLFDFIDEELEEVHVDPELAAVLATSRAFAAGTDRLQWQHLGVACTTLIEHLNTSEAGPITVHVYEVTLAAFGFVHALRREGADHPAVEAELRGVVRYLAELRATRTGRPVATEAAAVAARMLGAFR